LGQGVKKHGRSNEQRILPAPTTEMANRETVRTMGTRGQCEDLKKEGGG